MTRLLLTTGGTREPIDAVRFLGNRSSGRMGDAVADAARARGWHVTAVVAAVEVRPVADVCVDVETTDDLRRALAAHWPAADVLVMAAAVSDYVPAAPAPNKLRRAGPITLDLVPTPDLVAACGAVKRPDQRIVAYSLDVDDDDALDRAAAKMRAKNVDLLVFNPLPTMGAAGVTATLLRPDGRRTPLPAMGKDEFARRLLDAL